MENKLKILIFGYGNPGRKDDGLGPMLSEKIGEWLVENNITGIDVDSNYQLNIEDAYSIKDYDLVFFADASREDIDHFMIDQVTPSEKAGFNTHTVSPGFVLDLCNKLYNKNPQVFLLHIRGYDFSMEESLSDEARENLEKVFNHLTELLSKPDLIRKQDMRISI